MGGSASCTGDYGTSGTSGTSETSGTGETGGTSGTGETGGTSGTGGRIIRLFFGYRSVILRSLFAHRLLFILFSSFF